MKNSTLIIITMLVILPLIYVEARGGRGRGGFGSFLSGWRKSKSKHTYSGRSWFSKTTSDSNRVKVNKVQVKKQPPKMETHKLQGTHHINYPRTHALPPTATHYANHATIPQGAVYVPYTPPRSASSGLSDFFSGYVTGRLLSYPHSHVHHIHHQQVTNDAANRVIIIENGTYHSRDNFWPMDADVPLTPFNTSLVQEDYHTVKIPPIFHRSEQNINVPPTPENFSTIKSGADSTPQPPVHGIICMPMLFNETDAQDNTHVVQVEKLVCYPAPPPLSPSEMQTDGSPNCVTRNFIETNPDNPSETIVVPRQHCTPSTTKRSEPVVGDIASASHES